VPLLSERVATRLDEPAAAVKAAHWQQVAIEAIKQCGAVWLPRVEAPLTPAAFLERKERFDLALIGSLQPGAVHPRDSLQAFQTKNGHAPRTVGIWIGPEGDFALDELRAAEGAGAIPISLGPLVLRVETAAIFCLSFLNYELQTRVL
jgi:16S rRNA (uracil1498-N3)-methyltransferase